MHTTPLHIYFFSSLRDTKHHWLPLCVRFCLESKCALVGTFFDCRRDIIAPFALFSIAILYFRFFFQHSKEADKTNGQSQAGANVAGTRAASFALSKKKQTKRFFYFYFNNEASKPNFSFAPPHRRHLCSCRHRRSSSRSAAAPQPHWRLFGPSFRGSPRPSDAPRQRAHC